MLKGVAGQGSSLVESWNSIGSRQRLGLSQACFGVGIRSLYRFRQQILSCCRVPPVGDRHVLKAGFQLVEDRNWVGARLGFGERIVPFLCVLARNPFTLQGSAGRGSSLVESWVSIRLEQKLGLSQAGFRGENPSFL